MQHREAQPYKIFTELPLIPMMPSGGVYSSAKDMARYLQFHIHQGVAGGVSLLSGDLLHTMYTPQFLASKQEGYGLGIGVSRPNGALKLSHGGGGFGFISLMTWYPELKVGLVWLTNSADHDLQNWLSDQILAEVVQASQDLYRERATHTTSISVKLIGSFPLPNPNLPPWQQAFLLSPFLLLILSFLAVLTISFGWKTRLGTIQARVYDSLVLVVLMIFASIVCF